MARKPGARCRIGQFRQTVYDEGREARWTGGAVLVVGFSLSSVRCRETSARRPLQYCPWCCVCRVRARSFQTFRRALVVVIFAKRTCVEQTIVIQTISFRGWLPVVAFECFLTHFGFCSITKNILTRRLIFVPSRTVPERGTIIALWSGGPCNERYNSSTASPRINVSEQRYRCCVFRINQSRGNETYYFLFNFFPVFVHLFLYVLR